MMPDPWILHAPRTRGDLSGLLLVLWHGAGGDIDKPHLIALADAVAERGARAARARFPYRQAGKKMPDRMPELIASMRETIAELHQPEERLILGGHSMGGRAASMLAAEGDRVDGLLFLNYPLHPPQKQHQLRDAHLYGLATPMLFVGGDRDEFAELALLKPVVAKLERATLELFPGADHSLKKVSPEEVNARALPWLSARMRDPSEA